MTELTYQDVLRILRLIEASAGVDFELDFEGTYIKVERRAGAQTLPPRPAVPARTKAETQSLPAATDVPEVPEASPARGEFADAVEVKAPMGGMFYDAPAPGAPAFVRVGDNVKKGDQLGIVEVMKLFTPITAPGDGVILSVLVDNQQTVAKDTTLMLIKTREKTG